MVSDNRRKWLDYNEWKAIKELGTDNKRFHLSEVFKKYILEKVKENNSKTSISAISQWTDIKIRFNLNDKDIEEIIKNTVINNEKITWEEIWRYCSHKYIK